MEPVPKEFALATLCQWISDEGFKEVATLAEISAGVQWASSLEHVFLGIFDWNFNHRDKQYRLLADTFQEVVRIWSEEKWVTSVVSTLGRPRKGNSERECTPKRLFYKKVNLPAVFETLCVEAQVGSIEGMTAEEIAEMVDVPKKVISRVIRSKKKEGAWKVVHANRNGQRRREVRLSS